MEKTLNGEKYILFSPTPLSLYNFSRQNAERNQDLCFT